MIHGRVTEIRQQQAAEDLAAEQRKTSGGVR